MSGRVIFGVIAAIVIVVSIAVGIWNSFTPRSIPAPAPSAAATNTAATPEVIETGGHEEELDPELAAQAISRNAQFWSAYSQTDPSVRESQLREVAAPELVDLLLWTGSSGVDPVSPQRAVIISGEFNNATVVTQDQNGNWWQTWLVLDPTMPTTDFYVQDYDPATSASIEEANRRLASPTTQPS